MKSLLVIAGNLKRQSPTLDENMVLIRAMRDSNIPKFLEKDQPLFQALIQDLFPNMVIPKVENEELSEEIDRVLEENQLSKVQTTKLKIS